MATFLRLPIHLYRLLISPLLHSLCAGSGCGCRFHPSCSAYALEALTLHGALDGSLLALRRISRCHPWSEGGLDPVPGSKGVKSETGNLKLEYEIHRKTGNLSGRRP
jgi:putative membrane protein insertion efficiency factor